ncbi:MAG: hypothetical protein JGK17_06505 [Microcoleus sp. PH2017_10_PVI_O_A]|jgi:hypothetical protein|uniref:hypothetical protein n=1 Tax=Microcoleus TaxID=44471 RepID=UPI001681EEF7|nr:MULTISPECIES: hypothetical protein [unclassified Microcoleus]MBD1830340.1 hypothetical protein [Microcoleus sp. FACHB-61]TAE84421.1 MAG: hypothetical protein EAZ83_05520 [Oscillatoriales cyanobacterium]MCC3405239.1 hypothetical protein [Microcoleus sp. PH2017_10_PVI_O_A]MCC3459328.1 hypothetical protein [Microcoleus sp. PH2017_11_PCY_U_A]MCC3477358.1 hypothetical protein [Microcoleus sp. PH2017_12_PCY_D_A]
MSQNFSTEDGQLYPNPLGWQVRTMLIAIAQLVVKGRGIVNPPDFGRLSNDEIYHFIAKFGQAQ